MKNKINFFLVTAFLFFPIFSFASSQIDSDQLDRSLDKIDISRNSKNQKLTFLSSRSNRYLLKLNNKSGLRSAGKEFFGLYGKYFGIKSSDDMMKVDESQDKLDMNHLKYKQTYNNVPVFGSDFILHVNKNGEVTSANGRITDIDSLDTNKGISKEESVDEAREYWKKDIKKGDPELISVQKYILNPQILNKNVEDDQNHLVWEVVLKSKNPLNVIKYYIDTASKEIVLKVPGIKKAVNRNIFNCYAYNDYDACVILDTIHHQYYGRAEGDPVRGITDIDNLYDFAGDTHNYYATKFSRDGANNHGGLGDGTVTPYGDTDGFALIDYVPSMYDFCPYNAYFDDYDGSINFCENMVYPDVVGHEYTHGVDHYSADLVYSYESGALDEAFADIFGEALEKQVNGSNDWEMGEDNPLGAFRSLSNPPSISDGIGPAPDKYFGSNFYCGRGDSGGVHHNSTVISHAAYLVAQGGSFNGCTISGIGQDKEEAIFYRAVNNYFTPSTNFNDAYTALVSSCGDLYGAGSNECIQTKKALRAAEIDQDGQCGSDPHVSPECDFSNPPTILSVTSNKANGTYKQGSVIDIHLNFSEVVSSSGSITVNLNTGRSCNVAVTSSTTGTCNYTVQNGDSSDKLNVSSISGGITDEDGNSMSNFTPLQNLADTKSIAIDSTVPTIQSVTSDKANGFYKGGEIIPISVIFSEPVNGNITIEFNTKGACSGSSNGTNTVICNYTVQASDNISKLDNTEIKGNISDLSGNTLASFVPASSLAQNKEIVLDNIAPTIVGAVDGSVYNSDVIPYISEGTATLNNASFDSGTKITQDGDYFLTAVDLAGNYKTINFRVEKFISDVNSLNYAPKKASKKFRIRVYGVSLTKKNKVSVYFNGRKTKLTRVSAYGDSTVLGINLKYGKWPVGGYNFVLNYKVKNGRSWISSSLSKNNIFTIH